MRFATFVILLMSVFYCPPGHADGIPELYDRGWAPPVEARELSMDVRKISILRDGYYPGKDDWYSYVGLNWNVSSYRILYWENTVFFYGDRSQVRKIGWHYNLGAHVTNYVDFYWHHESEHDADHAQNDADFPGRGRFPIENSYGIRVNFLKNK